VFANLGARQPRQRRERIHAAAKVALATGALSLVACVVDAFSRGGKRGRWTFVVLVAAFASGVMMTRTGLSGGKIKHPEIKEGHNPNAPVTPDAPLDL
jgi:geranylgeranyl pyrophosphate synthase